MVMVVQLGDCKPPNKPIAIRVTSIR